MGKPTDLVQGTLDFLILKAVELEPKHGWAIARRIQQVSGDVLKVPQGSLYPALYRLEKQGWLVAHVGPTDTGRQVKFYSLTQCRPDAPAQRDRRLGTAVGCDQPRDPRHLKRRPERRLDMRWFHGSVMASARCSDTVPSTVRSTTTSPSTSKRPPRSTCAPASRPIRRTARH